MARSRPAGYVDEMADRRNWLQRLAAGWRWPIVVHARREPISETNDIIDLVDRFLDDSVRYPMEWDDFISWPGATAHAQAFLDELAPYEKELFSATKVGRARYARQLVRQRNTLAQLIGRETRNDVERDGAGGPGPV